ncbi:MAG: peroxidase family protein [Planctomycetota bacterium]
MAENRTIDGYGNNIANPEFGSAFVQEIRLCPSAYEDGVASPSGTDRPNPRAISNAVVAQPELIFTDRSQSDWTWQWGQFIDHDIALTENTPGVDPFHIPVPAGDTQFDPDGTGTVIIPMFRSFFDQTTGSGTGLPREQVNFLTSFIDGSAVYGSDNDRAVWLRTGQGGRLKTSPGNLLPFNDGTQLNVGPGGVPDFGTDLFVAGDIRVNEQVGLTCVHTLFVREHNRLASQLAAGNPGWSDEQIYQRARKIVGALIQVVTYFEFLPAILGPNAPDPHAAQYDPTINPTMANEFANACYRVGHTMLSPQIQRVMNNGQSSLYGPLSLRDAFFRPDRIITEGGIGPVLMGLSQERMQRIDNFIIEDVRSFLFGPPGAGGFDLAALNIQRARDHGLPTYNDLREAVNLPRVSSFNQVSSNPEVRARLAEAYDHVDLIDPWVGGISEDHLPGSSLGELFTAVLVDQFTRLRDGDRFWYANDAEFTPLEINALESTRLGDIIRRNSEMANIPNRVFAIEHAVPTVSHWGLLILCLGLATAAKLRGRFWRQDSTGAFSSNL